VEQVADHVTLINEGRVIMSEPLESIKQSHRVDGRVPSLDEIFVALVGLPAPAKE
jgi:ABC-type multidrug transport system ATPase subunit